MKQETREFIFPNRGHSVRKLALSLRELGTATVELYVEELYGMDQYRVSFIHTIYSVAPADKLADKLLTLGTRFTLIKDNQLKFYTDFSDIMSNPDTYL